MAPFIYSARKAIANIVASAFLLLSGEAFSITANDLMNGMSKDERNGYLSGLVDMLSYQSVLDGNRERARCINDAFYRNDDTLTRVVDAMLAFPDKEPVAVMIVVMNKTCGN